MSTASSAGAAARLEQLRRDLTAERKRTARAAIASGVIGLLVLIALGVYFTIGYNLLSETAQPDRIVTVGFDLLDKNLSEVRQKAQEQVSANAPVWAEGLSQQAQAALPTGREKLEDYVLTQVEDRLKEGTVLTEERFREFLRNNHAQLERDIQELSQSPDLAEGSMASLQQAVEKEIGTDMLAQSREFRSALSGILDKLKKYESGENLTPEEQNERRILLLARALQQQDRVGPSPSQRSGPPAMPGDAPSPARSNPSAPPGAESKAEPSEKPSE
jgi:hypothetical protein